MDAIAARLTTFQDRLRGITQRLGRAPSSVRLLAVSKTHSAESIATLYGLGVREFGENYAQELAKKGALLGPIGVRFVFIGTIQSNKIPLIVQHAAEIQSVASLRHAKIIAHEAARLGKVPYPIYLLVNAGDEASKSGVTIREVLPLAKAIQDSCPELALQGLMAIPPPLEDDDEERGKTHRKVPALYRDLRELANQVGRGLLSLGMSDDLEKALAAGSDCIRIGTALFGPRPSKDIPAN
jgi:pyridoxal phosphate enzyme (YggS family)